MSKKSQSLRSGIIFIVIVMSIFSFAMFSSPDKITSKIVGITGMEIYGNYFSPGANVLFSKDNPIAKIGETYSPDGKVNGYILEQGTDRVWLTDSIDGTLSTYYYNSQAGAWDVGILYYDSWGPINNKIESYDELSGYTKDYGYIKSSQQFKDTSKGVTRRDADGNAYTINLPNSIKTDNNFRYLEPVPPQAPAPKAVIEPAPASTPEPAATTTRSEATYDYQASSLRNGQTVKVSEFEGKDGYTVTKEEGDYVPSRSGGSGGYRQTDYRIIYPDGSSALIKNVRDDEGTVMGISNQWIVQAQPAPSTYSYNIQGGDNLKPGNTFDYENVKMTVQVDGSLKGSDGQTYHAFPGAAGVFPEGDTVTMTTENGEDITLTVGAGGSLESGGKRYEAIQGSTGLVRLASGEPTATPTAPTSVTATSYKAVLSDGTTVYSPTFVGPLPQGVRLATTEEWNKLQKAAAPTAAPAAASTPSQFKKDDRVRYSDGSVGTVTGFRSDGMPIVKWDITQVEGAIPPSYIAKVGSAASPATRAPAAAPDGPSWSDTAYRLAYGASLMQKSEGKVNSGYITKVNELAAELGTDPMNILTVIDFETAGTFKTSRHSDIVDGGSKKSIGAIGFQADALKELGTTEDEVLKMTPTEQLDLAGKYWKMKKESNPNLDYANIENLYLAVLNPSAAGKEGGAVFTKGDGTGFYESNDYLDIPDANGVKDGIITRDEVRAKMQAITKSPVFGAAGAAPATAPPSAPTAEGKKHNGKTLAEFLAGEQKGVTPSPGAPTPKTPPEYRIVDGVAMPPDAYETFKGQIKSEGKSDLQATKDQWDAVKNAYSHKVPLTITPDGKGGIESVKYSTESTDRKTETKTDYDIRKDGKTVTSTETTYAKKQEKYVDESGKNVGPTDKDITKTIKTSQEFGADGKVTSKTTETTRSKNGEQVSYTETKETPSGKEVTTQKGAKDPKITTNYKADGSPIDVWVNGKKDEKLTKSKQNNYKYGTALQDIMGALQTPGVGRFVGLFMDDDAFAEWRESVDKFMCESIIGGGTECWSSKMCQSYSEAQGDGYLSVEAPSGMLELAVHLEGERTMMTYVDDSGPHVEFIYKFTMMVKNPANSGKEMKFNVYLSGLGETPLYQSDITLKEGESFQRMGSSMVIQYSNMLYSKICIKFKDSIEAGNGEWVDEVCNKIIEYSGGPVPYETKASISQGGGDGSDNGANQVERNI